MSKKQKDIQSQLRNKMVEQQLQKSLELRRKIVNKELNKIQHMPLSQLMQRQRRPKATAPTDHTKKFFETEINKHLQSEGFESSLQNPAEKHAQIFKETEQKIKQYRKQLRKNPVMAQIKRGKLGFDTIFIAFAIVGFALLPIYFGRRIKQNQKKIVQSRGVDPRVIENLDEDSPISIDSVSEQSIHYLNKQREQEVKNMMERHNKITELKRELDL